MPPNVHGEQEPPRPSSGESISSLPGIWKYPAYRDSGLKSGPVWLAGRQKDEDIGSLWRVHDGLYDFSAWLRNHPGGSEWLSMTQKTGTENEVTFMSRSKTRGHLSICSMDQGNWTKNLIEMGVIDPEAAIQYLLQGTDITEAFEAHHISQTAEYLLPRFFVRKITVPRNSPYTFHKDGFYCTLRKRVFETLKGKVTGPTTHSTITADALLAGALLTAILAGYLWSFTLGTISGIYLALTTVSAHNFFHQKNNIRMYYFDLSLMSSRHWRVSHALSHHLFPNSVLDLEISLFEPLLQYLPKENKTFWGRYGPWVYSPLVYAFLFHVQYIVRMMIYAKGFDKGPYKTDFIPLIIPSLIYLYGGCQIQDALIMWFWITIVSSFTFSLIGLNAAHHHPDIFHDGDKPREDLDWGIQQLDAVQERPVIARSPFLALVTFGNHGLHHLFPTLDHGRLDKLMPVFLKTCEEFNADFNENTVIGLFKGQFQQCARNTPNLIPPGGKKK